MGSGRSEIFDCLFGLDRPSKGDVKLFGKPVAFTAPAQAIAAGVAFVTEDRKLTGLNLSDSIRRNISLVSLRDLSPGFLVNLGREAKASRETIDRFAIMVGRDIDPVSSLSGGNQQKVVLGKWFLRNPRVLLLDEPTRGVDVGAKREISRIVGNFAAAGGTVAMVSSEIDELLGVADRMMVMRDGRRGRHPRSFAGYRRETRSPLSLMRHKQIEHQPCRNETAAKAQRVDAADVAKRVVREYGIYLAFVILVVVLSFANQYFLTQNNISNVLLQTSINGVLAFGMTFVIITGGIDLSVGSVVALAGIVSASFATTSPQATVAGGPYPVFVALSIGVLVGVASGAIIGPIVARFNVPPFVATLGMLSAARGLTLIYAGGRPVPALIPEYRWIGNGNLFGVPAPVVIFAGHLSHLLVRPRADPVRTLRLRGRRQCPRRQDLRHQRRRHPLFGLRHQRRTGGHRRHDARGAHRLGADPGGHRLRTRRHRGRRDRRHQPVGRHRPHARGADRRAHHRRHEQRPRSDGHRILLPASSERHADRRGSDARSEAKSGWITLTKSGDSPDGERRARAARRASKLRHRSAPQTGAGETLEEMNMKMKVIGTLLAAVSAAALLASPAMAEKLKIGAAVYGLKAEFMQLWSAALKEHPAVKNGEVDVTVFDGNYDALVQQDQFNTMITQSSTRSSSCRSTCEAGVTAVQAAHEAGIPVIGSNTRVNTDLLTSYVGSDDVQSGYMEAKTVLDKIGCKGNVVIIEGPIGQSAQISRLEGNKKALAECPDVKVIEQQTANWSRAEAQKLMENWLTAHPGQINGVIGQNDEMALGAIEAIKAGGPRPEGLRRSPASTASATRCSP